MKKRSPRMAAATLGRASSLPGQPTSVDLRADARFIGQFLLNVNPLAYHQNKWISKELVSSALTLADQRIHPTKAPITCVDSPTSFHLPSSESADAVYT